MQIFTEGGLVGQIDRQSNAHDKGVLPELAQRPYEPCTRLEQKRFLTGKDPEKGGKQSWIPTLRARATPVRQLCRSSATNAPSAKLTDKVPLMTGDSAGNGAETGRALHATGAKAISSPGKDPEKGGQTVLDSNPVGGPKSHTAEITMIKMETRFAGFGASERRSRRGRSRRHKGAATSVYAALSRDWEGEGEGEGGIFLSDFAAMGPFRGRNVRGRHRQSSRMMDTRLMPTMRWSKGSRGRTR